MRRLILILLALGWAEVACAVCDPVIGVSNWVGCAIDADGAIQCFGTNNSGQISSVPAGSYSTLDGGDCDLCAVKDDTSIDCWGCDGDDIVTNAPSGTGYAYVTPGTCSACALKTDDTVECWGGCVVLYDDAEGSFTYDQIAGDQEQYCGVRTTGAIACWGIDLGQGVMTEPAGTDFAYVDATADHACAIKDDASMVCWGSNEDGESTVPAGTYLAVAVVDDATCAIQADGDLDCWTDNLGLDELLTVPSGTFVALECSGATCCAVSTAGNVECWGEDTAGIVAASAGDECPSSTPASYVVVMVGM